MTEDWPFPVESPFVFRTDPPMTPGINGIDNVGIIVYLREPVSGEVHFAEPVERPQPGIPVHYGSTKKRGWCPGLLGDEDGLRDAAIQTRGGMKNQFGYRLNRIMADVVATGLYTLGELIKGHKQVAIPQADDREFFDWIGWSFPNDGTTRYSDLGHRPSLVPLGRMTGFVTGSRKFRDETIQTHVEMIEMLDQTGCVLSDVQKSAQIAEGVRNLLDCGLSVATTYAIILRRSRQGLLDLNRGETVAERAAIVAADIGEWVGDYYRRTNTIPLSETGEHEGESFDDYR